MEPLRKPIHDNVELFPNYHTMETDEPIVLQSNYDARRAGRPNQTDDGNATDETAETLLLLLLGIEV